VSSAVLSSQPASEAPAGRSKSVASGASSARDHRLDFWRGLCLVDMVLVHLVYEGVKMGKVLEPVLGEFTRFAAGGFIFLAGLGITYIFLPKAQDERRRWGTYQSLWRRALYLLFVHYAASLSFIFIYPLRDYPGVYPGPIEFVTNVLLFREGTDLLLFYVMMVGMSPVLVEVIRRGYGWAVGLASLVVFGIGQHDPYALSLPIQKNFPLLLWQMIFVMGMLAGAAFPRWDALGRRAKAALAVGGCVAVALLSAIEYTAWGWSLHIPFVKNPLSWAEAIRYLAMITTIMTLTDLAWRWIAGSNVVGFLTRLGRRSLAVYVAHVWVVAIILAVARRTEWLGSWQVVWAVTGVAMLWAWTCVLDSLSEAPKSRGEEPSLIGPAFWRVSGAAVAGVAVLFAIHAALPYWHRDPMAKMLAKMPRPTDLSAYVAMAGDGPNEDDEDSDYEPAPLIDPGEEVSLPSWAI
jgi:hypothetical protein